MAADKRTDMEIKRGSQKLRVNCKLNDRNFEEVAEGRQRAGQPPVVVEYLTLLVDWVKYIPAEFLQYTNRAADKILSQRWGAGRQELGNDNWQLEQEQQVNDTKMAADERARPRMRAGRQDELRNDNWQPGQKQEVTGAPLDPKSVALKFQRAAEQPAGYVDEMMRRYSSFLWVGLFALCISSLILADWYRERAEAAEQELLNSRLNLKSKLWECENKLNFEISKCQNN